MAEKYVRFSFRGRARKATAKGAAGSNGRARHAADDGTAEAGGAAEDGGAAEKCHAAARGRERGEAASVSPEASGRCEENRTRCETRRVLRSRDTIVFLGIAAVQKKCRKCERQDTDLGRVHCEKNAIIRVKCFCVIYRTLALPLATFENCSYVRS